MQSDIFCMAEDFPSRNTLNRRIKTVDNTLFLQE
jgi:hypothetical protein